MEKPKEIVILSGARTAIGRFGGIFKDLLANQLAVPVAQEVIAKAGVDKAELGDVILGNGVARSDEPNLARIVGLRSGIPFTTPAFTLTRQCASGMQAVASAAMGIICGQVRRCPGRGRREHEQRAVRVEDGALGAAPAARRDD
jgi:acetyl-CoA C-acetyltransferase